MLIRTANTFDLAALAGIYRRASLSNDGDRQNLLRHPEFLEFGGDGIAEGQTVIALTGDVPLGFVTTTGRPPVLELDDLFVEPDWMRRGVATQLVHEAIRRARAAGATSIEVTANDHALQFYRSVGFAHVGTARTTFSTAPRLRLDLASRSR